MSTKCSIGMSSYSYLPMCGMISHDSHEKWEMRIIHRRNLIHMIPKTSSPTLCLVLGSHPVHQDSHPPAIHNLSRISRDLVQWLPASNVFLVKFEHNFSLHKQWNNSDLMKEGVRTTYGIHSPCYFYHHDYQHVSETCNKLFKTMLKSRDIQFRLPNVPWKLVFINDMGSSSAFSVIFDFFRRIWPA